MISNIYFFSISFYNRINIIIGDSATGKSWALDALSQALRSSSIYSVECNIPVHVVTSTSGLYDAATLHSGSLIIFDEDTAGGVKIDECMGYKDIRRIQSKYENYYLEIDRSTLDLGAVNVKAAYKLSIRLDKNKRRYLAASSLIPIVEDVQSSTSIKKISAYITEDETTGRMFWEYAFNKLKVYPKNVIKGKNDSAGHVINYVEAALKDLGNFGNMLVIVDYDRGASIIYGLYKWLDANNLLDRVALMPLESFEEIICNSDFILSKFPEIRSKVVDYKEHITCESRSTGKYFSQLLYDTVKVRSPERKDNEHNKFKFYDKNMQNFKECFILDCCSYNTKSGECILYYDTNKLIGMLANKFEIYRQLL